VTEAEIPSSSTVVAAGATGDTAKLRQGWPPKPELSRFIRTKSSKCRYKGLAQAKNSGGRVVKPAGRAFWGGWYGYFADTENNLWEVAHNPDFPIDADGRISLPA
jgi:uncharacterized glyoxalase superfamily protein PhnB